MVDSFDLSPVTLARFIRAIAVLAFPAEDQIAWIRSVPIGLVDADELALEFDDGYRLLPQFESLGWIPEAVRGPADDIDRLLTQMSGPSGPWSFDDLRSDSRWTEVRLVALRALSALDGGVLIR